MREGVSPMRSGRVTIRKSQAPASIQAPPMPDPSWAATAGFPCCAQHSPGRAASMSARGSTDQGRFGRPSDPSDWTLAPKTGRRLY
jgi:hypothetical protein